MAANSRQCETEGETAYSMKDIWKDKIFLLLVISVLLLIAMLSYPFAPDQTIFAVGGDLIFTKGALPYRDFLEAKPPLIFYIYGFAQWIFGHHEWSIRALDILYHIICYFFFYRLVVETFKSKRVAIVSLLVYTIFYTAGGYWGSAQTESFALLPSLLLANVLLHFEKKSLNEKGALVLPGFFIGFGSIILFLLKFTLVFSFFGCIFFLLFFSKQTSRNRISLIISSTLCLFLFVGLFFVYLYSSHSLDNFFIMLNYLRNYADIRPALSLETIKNSYYQNFPAALFIYLTPAMLCLAIYGLYAVKKQISAIPLSENNPLLHFFKIALSILSFGLISILFERKNYNYQFLRISWCIAPFIAFAVVDLIKRFDDKEWEKRIILQRQFIRKVFPFILLFFILLFYSPLPRIIYHPIHWVWLTVTNNDSEKDTILKHDTYDVAQIKKVTSYISHRSQPQDEVFLWGNSVGVYFFLNKLPPTICLANGQFIPSWPPTSWRDTVIKQLRESAPRYFIIELNDAQPLITGNTMGSYEYLLHWEALYSYLNDNYKDLIIIGNFKIYEKIGQKTHPI